MNKGFENRRQVSVCSCVGRRKTIRERRDGEREEREVGKSSQMAFAQILYIKKNKLIIMSSCNKNKNNGVISVSQNF